MDTIKKTKVFARGLCLAKLFICFLVGSLLGSLLEEILYFFQHGEWTIRHDLIYGPFSSLYGFGFVILLLFLGFKNKDRGVFKTFLYCALLGGFFEYITSLFLEVWLNIKFWDYSKMFLNINGRTTILFMIAWGIIGVIIMKIIYPFLSDVIEKFPYKIAQPIYIVSLILMFINISVSYSAFVRFIYRGQGYNPKTFIGRYYDEVYNDDFMYKKFPILKEI